MPGMLMCPCASLSFDEQLDQSEDRVGRRAAVHSRMQILRRTASLDLGVDQSAQADAQRRDAFGVQLGIGNQRDIGLELGGILGDILGDGRAADFLFAFDQELHVHRKLAVHREQRFDGLDVAVHLALVVGRAARVDVAVANRRLEGRRDPFIQGIGRLHIVVPVAQNGRFPGRVQPIGVDQRMPRGLDHLDMFHLRGAQAGGDELGGALDVGDVLGQRADAGDAEEILQLGEQPVLVCFDKRVSGEGHNPL